MKIFLCEKAPEGGAKKVYLTFEQALAVIRKLDNITCGIPKIVYLVGWQFDGHDSKYPAWTEVNHRLKRPQDETAVDSLRWLIRQGRKHNTTVSLHINMFDAYEDSPLWDTYVKHDIVGKDKDGNVIFGEVHGGQRSAQISYTREWELGFTCKRIDGLLDMLPELKQGGTIHLDAHHTFRPLGKREPISRYLGYTPGQETATQRKIFRYWRDKGIDATCEGAHFLRRDPFVGLQAFTWASEGVEGRYGPALYATTPMRAEPEIMKDPENLSGLMDQFCMKVVPWYHKNNATDTTDMSKMLQKDDICMPALWKKQQALIAYSRNGYDNKTWTLPPNWKGVTKVTVSRITLDGLKRVGEAGVMRGKLSLSLEKGAAVAVVPAGKR
jgi:hypothetical protein